MRDVVIFGNGDQARTALVYLAEDSPYNVVGFTAHERFIRQPELLGLPVFPFEAIAESHPPSDCDLFVAIGFEDNNHRRAVIFDECRAMGYELVSYLSTRASYWGDLKHGENCLIGELTALQPFVEIGNDVVISCGTMIGHDARIGDHVFIGPGVTIPGGVTIGAYSFLGANATLRNGITIGERCIVGAGALILNDAADEEVRVPKSTKLSPLKSSALAKFMGRRRSS
ncbi:MAG: acetyltransferase [Geminicoccaceae bacterium]